MKTTHLLLTSFFLGFFLPGAFAQGTVVPLYKGVIPGAKQTPVAYKEAHDTASGYFTNVSVPSLTVYTPKKGTANGTAVIIIPGGGYRVLVDEGEYFAREFTSRGITAFALKYRLPSDEIMTDKSTGPLQDAQMAIQYVRRNTKKYGLDSNKIGFIGLSAGGHLATTVATHPETVLIDNPENTSLRPDFLVLAYPVISFSEYPVTGTVARLLGPAPSSDSIRFFSSEKNAGPRTPPTFLVHAGDDARVAVQHSLLFYQALLQAKVNAELHILPNGGHAFALEHPTRGNQWFSWCMDWLHDNVFGIQVKNKGPVSKTSRNR
ncbi:MAG: alpha/beta hydrolase [Ferruginibacter sp.]